MAERLLFDRSIFHGTKFQQLKSSGIRSAIQAGRYKVFFTPMFLEETLAYSLQTISEFNEHWNFILSLIGQKWFKPAEDIIVIELGDTIKGANYYLQPKVRKQQARRNIAYLVDGTVKSDHIDEIMATIQTNTENRKEFRKLRLEMRTIVKPGEYDLQGYFEDLAEWFIEKGLMAYHVDSANYLTTWRTKRKQCVFSEQFIKGWLSHILIPVRDHNVKVATNDRSDAEQLAFLIWADTIVSDDSRFMKKAFDLLYPNSAKKFLTLDQFLARA